MRIIRTMRLKNHEKISVPKLIFIILGACLHLFVTKTSANEWYECEKQVQQSGQGTCFVTPFYSLNAKSSQTMSVVETSTSLPCSKSDVFHQRNGKVVTERSDGDIDLASTTSLAVVPYDENSVLPHKKPSRSFHLAGREFKILQDWNSGGVAAVVWDAAVVLAEYLSENPNLIKGKKVLELGAGTGLTGMVVASLGANVITTERAEALPHLKDSISLNQGTEQWNITTQVLDWRDTVDSSVLFDVDVVLGADIIYIEDTFPDLLRTIQTVAPDPRTSVLLSCRIRYERDTKFLDMLREFFIVEEIFYNSKLDIKIFSAIKRNVR